MSVDDPKCLVWGADASRGVPAGKQVLLPRFVDYDTENPASFHTSLIEPPDIATAGIGLEMPERHRMDGGGVTNAAAIVDALANDPATDVFLELSTANSLSRLAVGAAPSTVNVDGAGSAKLSLSGPLGAVRQAQRRSVMGRVNTRYAASTGNLTMLVFRHQPPLRGR